MNCLMGSTEEHLKIDYMNENYSRSQQAESVIIRIKNYMDDSDLTNSVGVV